MTLFGNPHASTAAQAGKAADGPTKHEPGPIARLVDAWWTRLIAAVYDGGLAVQEAEYGSGETARDYLCPTKHEPGPIARLVDAWWTRLIAAVYDGGLAVQEAEYGSGETARDYLWNTVGTGAWGMVFPALTVVATQLAGIKQAGMFSMAFAAGTLLMFLSNFGVRTYQVSDIDEKCSFASYQAQRWLTSLLALSAGLLYCTVRGYDATMLMLSIGIYIYKIVDGLADVYEGRLQQADKLYLAGISQALRSVSVIIAFSVLLFITRSIALAGAVAGLVAVATLILVTIPLALLETEASRRMSPLEIGGLFRHCLPLFSALFMFNLIESVPKFAMEGMLPYDSQLYFNALFFPAQGILLAAGFLYKPQLLRLANIWSNPRRRRKFDLIVLASSCSTSSRACPSSPWRACSPTTASCTSTRCSSPPKASCSPPGSCTSRNC